MIMPKDCDLLFIGREVEYLANSGELPELCRAPAILIYDHNLGYSTI